MSKSKNVTLHLPVTVVMGGKTFPSGTPVSVDASTAEDLRARYREMPSPAAETQPKRPAKPSGDALTKAILQAVEGFDPEEDFTQAGLPSMAALERALGYDVTADERAAAMEEAKQPNPEGLQV
ncbi:hypothetical protein [Stappia sp. ES.058]|uniref:hypothetical protein n=1 Tax=Stappia sp. ES.058 TaxID=1881061 RepID=UPI00087BCFBD|nr:hypothetical protein [Stappia sp. ES.058]SDT97026.1 hypothetical protein SAMN05428979_0807 [Stappia sp. ES.058]